MQLISIIIPVYNGEKSLNVVCSNIINVFSKLNYDYEIILVDDNSLDNSSYVMENLSQNNNKIISIFLKKNFGQQNAIFCGMKYAKGDLIINMDDDLQHPTNIITQLVSEILKGYDIVYAITDTKYIKRYRNFGSKLTDLLFTYILKKPKQKRISSFRILNRQTLNNILQDNYRYVYISAAVIKHTDNIGNIYYEKSDRKHGVSNYNFIKQAIIFSRILLYYSDCKIFSLFRKKDNQFEIKKIINR